MQLNESNLRKFVKNIINENLNLLNEVKPGKELDWFISDSIKKLIPDVEPGEFPHVNIMKEVQKELKIKLNNVFSFQNEYTNFYIVKLGSFIIKDNSGNRQISFHKSGVEDKKFSFPYVYIYNDTALLLRFGSTFFDTDESLKKEALEYINNRKLNVFTKEEKGELIIDLRLDTDNLIDVTDYSKIARPQAPKSEPKLAKEKGTYRVGQPLKHDKFGKGRILATKSIGPDSNGVPQYDVTVQFDDKARTLRVKSKQEKV